MKRITTYIKYNPSELVEAAPLAVFRIFFGLLMLVSMIRFLGYGWVEKFYIEPKYFFSYYGFDWVRPLGEWTYILFVLCGISSVGIALGYKYRVSIILFFLSFTYIELMDKTTYLNHYYFISLLSFLMIFLPASRYFSIDAKLDPTTAFQRIPRWSIDVLKLLICFIYLYAGLAKLQSDWLMEAMPLKIWLPSKDGVPLLGDLLQQSWIHYTFSWGGALYDLTIPFLLLYSRTRLFAFVMVIIFHSLTRILFPIGMFPYIMIASAFIFFQAGIQHKLLKRISNILSISKSAFDNNRDLLYDSNRFTQIKGQILIAFFVIQILLPFRFLLYPGHLFWTEQGYRFSWRVMLMEKAGYANFKIVDSKSDKQFSVNNSDFLTAQQEKMMSTQPDMILQYAHFLGAHFKFQGHENVEVYVDSYVALNGQRSQPFIDPQVNLLNVQEGFKHKSWILPWKKN